MAEEARAGNAACTEVMVITQTVLKKDNIFSEEKYFSPKILLLI